MGVSHPCWKSQGRSPQDVCGAAGAGTPPGVQAQFPLPILCDPAQGTCPVSDYFPVAPQHPARRCVSAEPKTSAPTLARVAPPGQVRASKVGHRQRLKAKVPGVSGYIC